MGKLFLNKKLTSFQIIIFAFAAVILIGALLLMLPISSNEHIVTPFDDTLFTAVSAVCVTGLVVKDTATYWSYFGQAVILILIQIGGLGVITVASLITMVAGKKISLMQRRTIQNSLSAPQIGGGIKLIRFVFKTSFFIEFIGIVLLLPVFVRRFGAKGIWMAAFHSVSAFCNAGFDLMGDKSGLFSSLTMLGDDLYAMCVFSMLIIVGGIGFLTWSDIVTKKWRIRQYRLQSKVILATTFFLIVIPLAIFFFYDFSTLPLKERFCASLFQAVTPRTAGFNSVNFDTMSESGRAIIMILMMIGGSPGSTAGGMKTTTIAVLVLTSISAFKMRKDTSIFRRRIEESVVKNAATILSMYIFLSLATALIMNMTESFSMHQCLFETISAIGTVGLTLGITPQLGMVSRILLMILMFVGRVGGLTVIYAAFSKQEVGDARYPVETMMLG